MPLALVALNYHGNFLHGLVAKLIEHPGQERFIVHG